MWKFLLTLSVFIYGAHSILVNLSKEDGRIPYSSASVILFVELCKLLFSISFLSSDIMAGKVQNQPLRTWLAFSVPAILYCINNNLCVHVLLFIDPASYQLLVNIKIVTTAVLYRIIIKRPISRIKWVALSLITVAGVCNSYGGIKSTPAKVAAKVAEATDAPSQHLDIYVSVTGILLVLLISLISGFAGVYTEYIVKRQFQISLHQQNTMLYTFGVLFNFLTYAAFVNSSNLGTRHELAITRFLASVFGVFSNLFVGYNRWTVVLICSEACGGLILSAVMKYASNITKLFIISSAMVVTTVLSVILFSLQLNLYFLLAFALVVFALFLNQKG